MWCTDIRAGTVYKSGQYALIREVVCIKVKQDDMKGSRQPSAFKRPRQRGHKFKVILAFRVGVLSP